MWARNNYFYLQAHLIVDLVEGFGGVKSRIYLPNQSNNWIFLEVDYDDDKK